MTAMVTGGDSFWVGDHLNSLIPRSIATPEHMGIGARLVPKVDAILEPWTMLGHLAAKRRFSRLRLGVGVTDASRRNPAVTAQAAATLHLLTKGRAMLGIGVGEREGNQPYGVEWSKPVARFEEAIATIRALWDSNGELVTRDSPYFPLHNAVFDLPPYRGKWPEIWVASQGPRMLRITGRYGDAWVPFTISRPGDYAASLAAIHESASNAGRDPAAIVPALNRAVVTGRNRDDVDEALNGVLMKSSALAAPAEVWARHGVEHPLGAKFSGVQDLIPQLIDREAALSYTDKVPLSLMKEICFHGTPDDVLDQVAQWRDHGLRYLLVLNGSQLNPRLRKAAAASSPFAKVLRGLRKL
ncbi:LLM class flavin-dependent oxidoreductase [Mycolicibacterium austroafricanum]|uniref:LLM class flavin-dependent oxidoreductase n=1 Tax=Mycolicibacterium austroafricanum TaxID=39687 RepID=UPI003AF3F389